MNIDLFIWKIKYPLNSIFFSLMWHLPLNNAYLRQYRTLWRSYLLSTRIGQKVHQYSDQEDRSPQISSLWRVKLQGHWCWEVAKVNSRNKLKIEEDWRPVVSVVMYFMIPLFGECSQLMKICFKFGVRIFHDKRSSVTSIPCKPRIPAPRSSFQRELQSSSSMFSYRCSNVYHFWHVWNMNCSFRGSWSDCYPWGGTGHI
jgi:hypothetical protein